MHRTVLACGMAASLLIGGCATNEQTGQLFGAGGGALLGGALGRAIGHNGTGMAIGAAVGALGGYFVGGAIGRSLDQRDQQRAAQATQTVLYEPAPAAVSSGYASTTTSSSHTTRSSRARSTSATPSASWNSDHSGARGSATVIAVQPTAGGGECRTVHEIAYVGGQELNQDQRYCRGNGTDWQKA